MKTKELIEILKQVDPEKEVVIEWLDDHFYAGVRSNGFEQSKAEGCQDRLNQFVISI